MDSDYSDNESERMDQYLEIEEENSDANSEESQWSDFSDGEGHHEGEPLADQEWLQMYAETEKETKKTEELLKKRLQNVVSVSEW